MKTSIKITTTALTVMVILTVASGVIASIDKDDKPIVSVTPYVGHASWDTDLQQDDGLVFGGRGAFHILQWLSLEGTYGRNSTNRLGDDMDITMTHLGADLVAELLPSARFNPYLTAGWAQLNYTPDTGLEQYLNGWEAGVGAKIRLGGNNANYRAIRLEVRDVMSDLSVAFPNYGDTKHNLIASVGMQFAFGKSSRDSDGDGIRDRSDSCQDTPIGAMINDTGCPLDTDGDGIFDGLDKCDNTPAGAVVDDAGCPVDSDGDGVYDGLDKCGGTKANLQVDANGCPIAVTEIEEELLDTGRISTSNIVFATSSSDLDLSNNKTLGEVGAALANWPELRVEIGGFTDSSGSETYNQQLSEKRAQSVRDYLEANYPTIQKSQYTAIGYGEANPIADNQTAEGRAKNRRVEFKVLNTEDLKRQIENRKMLER